MTVPSTINDMQDLIIKFDGETNQITANTLINSLIHFNHLVQDISTQIDSTKSVEIKIKALPPGSFLVDIVLSTKQALGSSNLLSKENLGYAKDVIKTVSEIYKLAKFLKGKKPKSTTNQGQNISVENNQGAIQVFDFRGANIYLNDKGVRGLISQSFETLENDSSVSGFELLDNNKNKLLEIPRNEFLDLSVFEDEPINEKTEKLKTITDAIITTFSFDWGLKKKWTFYYEGNKIPIKIIDEDFLKAIEKGESFAKGDALLVDLEIKQEFNVDANVFINVSYSLIKYKKHILRDEQTKIVFPSKDK